MPNGAPDEHELVWIKSSHSAGDGGDCVEIARTDTLVHVRDSKCAARAVVAVSPEEWAAFLWMAAGRG